MKRYSVAFAVTLLVTACTNDLQTGPPSSPAPADVRNALVIEQTAVLQISAGGNHNCVLRSNQTVSCWGSDANGEVGVPAELVNVVQISSGNDDTCAAT